MDSIQKMALSKFKLTSSEKDAIPAGTYDFDFVVRCLGSLRKLRGVTVTLRGGSLRKLRGVTVTL